MNDIKIGFIGAGRIVNILLGGWKRKGVVPGPVRVTEPHSGTAENLKKKHPEIEMVSGVQDLKGADLLIVAVHPPVMAQVLGELKTVIAPQTVVCSLVPKIPFAKLEDALSGHNKIIRMNPNAPSLVNSGFNPVAFGSGVTAEEKAWFLNLMNALGHCPETKEENIEAYAVISAMGPTYLWFQLYQLIELAKTFGLTDKEALDAVSAMAIGAVHTMTESRLAPEGVMDLLPVKPMAEEEAAIKAAYRNRLTGMMQKLKS
jgi:pyrroline-5-carboxylate reductase